MALTARSRATVLAGVSSQAYNTNTIGYNFFDRLLRLQMHSYPRNKDSLPVQQLELLH